MSVQTPIFVSNNTYSSTQSSFSVVDANENIYTSINYLSAPNYGSIQKTTFSGTTTIFLQLNSGNTPPTPGNTSPNYPRGMCFDSTRSTLYYIVYQNSYIYKITDFTTANPTPVNTTITGPNSFSPFCIIINNQNSNMFYISNLTTYNGVWYVYNYTNNTTSGVYNTVFNLNASGYPESSYGLAQDFTGLNLYIGLANGRILKGNLSTLTVTLWLTLPQLAPVVSFIFKTNYTLFANTSNGYGYIITIDPTTGVGSPQLYYDDTSTTIIGGLGLNPSSTYLYGISSTQLWKINSILPTGYKFPYNNVQKDFSEIFDQSNPGSIITRYKSTTYGNLDLGQIFTQGNNGIFTFYKNPANVDLGSLFKQRGIPVITTPVYCYKQAIISWTNTDTPTSYILYRDNVVIQNPAFSPFTDLNLTNGVTYIYTVTAIYPDRVATSAPFSSNQPATVTYFNYTGTKTSSPNGLYSNIYLTSDGTLSYNCPTQITGIDVVVVGGGGGGGAGEPGYESYTRWGGGGGGGGEIKTVSSITINTSTTISATIGIGGAAGTSSAAGGSGGATTFTYNSVATTSTFGTGGQRGNYNNLNNYGFGGGSGATFGGDGGKGQASGLAGQNSSYYTSTGLKYGGGGGGGSNYILTGGYGGNGAGGLGGAYASVNPPYTGEDGVAYGGGGGGGCEADVLYGNGGAGRQGVVVLTILN